MGVKKILAFGIFGILVVALGFAIYSFGRSSVSGTAKAAVKAEEQASDYSLLAKRLFTENPNDSWVNFSSLRNQINKYYTDNNLVGSIYFEYLPTGTSVRINGDERNVAASLIKLPAAMDLYKASELGKVNLDQTITLKQEWLDDQYGTLYQKGAGYQLTLREAARIMLQESDNTALKAVSASLGTLLNADQNSLSSLDMDYQINKDFSVSLGARSYSSTLKCLYFACYNNKEDSQKILEYLTDTPYNTRIVAGVNDKKVKIAHKIGTHFNEVQSDCGIVYYPKRNYVLCIMIAGNESPESDKKIADISKITYDFIKNIQTN